jgi:hypothetical protein
MGLLRFLLSYPHWFAFLKKGAPPFLCIFAGSDFEYGRVGTGIKCRSEIGKIGASVRHLLGCCH